MGGLAAGPPRLPGDGAIGICDDDLWSIIEISNDATSTIIGDPGPDLFGTLKHPTFHSGKMTPRMWSIIEISNDDISTIIGDPGPDLFGTLKHPTLHSGKMTPWRACGATRAMWCHMAAGHVVPPWRGDRQLNM